MESEYQSFMDETGLTPEVLNKLQYGSDYGGSQSDDSEFEREKFSSFLEEEITEEINNETPRERRERRKKEQKSGDAYGSKTREEILDYSYRYDVDRIKKKAGLLDTPSNYLRIGILDYYANKREENLENYYKASKQKEKKIQELYSDGDAAFIKGYSSLEKALKELGANPPPETLEKVSFMMLAVKNAINDDIVNLQYPFLN